MTRHRNQIITFPQNIVTHISFTFFVVTKKQQYEIIVNKLKQHEISKEKIKTKPRIIMYSMMYSMM